MQASNFRHVKRKISKYGYGNRRQTICKTCRKVVMDADPGNGAGFRYDAIYRKEAMQKHRCSKKALREIQQAGE